MNLCELKMESATSNPNPKPLDGFVEVPSDFISSLISQRDPQFFEVIEDNSVSSCRENDVDDNKSNSSDDVEVVAEINASARGVSVEKPFESVGTLRNTNGVSHDDSHSKTLSEVPDRHFDNENTSNSDHDYCGNKSTDNSTSIDSGKAQEMVVNRSATSSTNLNLYERLKGEQYQFITQEESEFRSQMKRNFSFLEYRLHCTVCDLHIGARADFAKEETASLHVPLGVLICCKCMKIRNKILYSKPTFLDGNHFIDCCWCYKSVPNRQRCSNCPRVFCEGCIKRNLGNSELQSVKSKIIDWICYVCDTKPIWRLRLIAWELLQYIRMKRTHLKKQFPNAKPGELQDVDLARCCKSKSHLRSLLNEPSPPTTVQVERPSTSYPYNTVPTLPATQQSSYATPLFSLFSDSSKTSESASQSSTFDHINNGRIVFAHQISHSSVIGNDQTFKNNNTVKYNNFSKTAQSVLKKPIELIGTDDTSVNYIDPQNARNENLPPQLLIYNRPNTLVGNSADKSSFNYMSQQPAPISSHSNNSKFNLVNSKKKTYEQTKKTKRVIGKSPSQIEWIKKTILSSSSLLDSCRNRLSAIERAIENENYDKDLEIKIANILHNFTRVASSKFQEIESQILEYYWLVRKARGLNDESLSFDKIAQEYANIIEESDNNCTTEVDPASFLELKIDDKKMKCSQNSNSSHEGSNTCDLRTPILKLEKCDKLLKSNKRTLTTTFKTTKKNSVQYSNKIKALIEKYGISESMVAVVPLENLKAFK